MEEVSILSCNMIYRHSQTQTFTFALTATPVIDTPASSAEIAAIGSNVTLSCTSRGSPPDMFTWRKDAGPIAQSTSITAVTHTISNAVFRADYTITDVSLNDGGTYTCEVINPIGNDTKSITIIVTGMHITILYHMSLCYYSVNTPPTVTVSPSGPIQGGMVGSPQAIHCNANTTVALSVNLLTFTWIGPGGGSVSNNSRVIVSEITSNGSSYTSSLQFNYLMEGDEGSYTCNVAIFNVSESDSTTIDALTGKLITNILITIDIYENIYLYSHYT